MTGDRACGLLWRLPVFYEVWFEARGRRDFGGFFLTEWGARRAIRRRGPCRVWLMRVRRGAPSKDLLP